MKAVELLAYAALHLLENISHIENVQRNKGLISGVDWILTQANWFCYMGSTLFICPHVCVWDNTLEAHGLVNMVSEQ